MSAGWQVRGNSLMRVIVGLALIIIVTYVSYQAGRFSGTTVITAPDDAWALDLSLIHI